MFFILLIIFYFKNTWIYFKLAHNGLALGEEADFEALNCQSSTKVDTWYNVQLTTKPAFLPNACYGMVFCLY